MSPSLNYDSPQAIRAFLDSRGWGARKKYGQNFLVNPHIRDKLLDALEMESGAGVWEIGPGLGAMTWGLLRRGAAVTAFEIDRGFVEILGNFFRDAGGFRLVPGDVLKTWPGEEPGTYLLGNLPYNIAAALLADFIERGRLFKRMVVTVQREVARRMLAKPGSRDYSSLSVLCASAYTVTPLLVIKGASFYPVPRVESQGVRFDLRPRRGPEPALFHPLVRFLFASRRKTVKNNLETFLASRIINREARGIALGALERCGIDPRQRAERLEPGQFSALAEAVEAMSGGIDGGR